MAKSKRVPPWLIDAMLTRKQGEVETGDKIYRIFAYKNPGHDGCSPTCRAAGHLYCHDFEPPLQIVNEGGTIAIGGPLGVRMVGKSRFLVNERAPKNAPRLTSSGKTRLDDGRMVRWSIEIPLIQESAK